MQTLLCVACLPRSLSRVLAGMSGLILLVNAGCGGNDVPYPSTTLKGMVMVDGKPIDKGSLSISPLGQGQAVGATIRDGSYTAKGVPLGAVVVTFNATHATGKMIPGYSEPLPEVVSIIPAKYQTGQQIEIHDGQEEQHFNLTSR